MLNADQAAGMLGCLNGIRFISMTWVIMGHTFMLLSFSLIGKSIVSNQWLTFHGFL